MNFIKSVQAILNLPEEQRHREYLRLFSRQGLRFNVMLNGKPENEWQENYEDSKFEPRINLVERLPCFVVVEFDEPEGEGMKPSEALEETEKLVKKKGWSYLKSSHKGKSDYLWLEFSSPVSDNEAERFLKWICPKNARIDTNFSSSVRVFPVLFATHRKHSANREVVLYVREGKKINFSKLKIPKNISLSGEAKTEDKGGYRYKTFEKTEKSIPEELLNILKNPNLFSDITEAEFDKKIVGETESRKVIFLCSQGRLVDNCQIASYNLLVNDEAGVGKDYVVNAVLEIIPKEIYIHKTRISPNVFTYWHNPKYEPEWTWNGKVFYPEDISENVLNSDVFKVMCSKGSSATITINQMAIEIDIKGKPVMITTTATATPNPELTRRFVILNLDSSIDQTKAIMKRHSEFKKKGIVPEYNPRYAEAMKYLQQVKVKIPFADLIDNYFPSTNVIMRTHYPRFLDFICASAGFFQYQRKKDSEGFVIAEGQDYDIARDCFLKLCSNKYMISLTINQKKILSVFESCSKLKGSVSKLHSIMPFVSDRALQTNLGILAKYGILGTSTGKDTWNRDVEEYSLAESYKPNEQVDIPNYETICRNTSIPTTPTLPSIPSIPSIPLTSIPNLKNENPLGSEGSEGSEVGFGGQETLAEVPEVCCKCGSEEATLTQDNVCFYCLKCGEREFVK